MRVSDLVKDVIFLVGSMECFSQVTDPQAGRKGFLLQVLVHRYESSCSSSCLFSAVLYVKRREPFLGGDGGCSLHHGCNREEC